MLLARCFRFPFSLVLSLSVSLSLSLSLSFPPAVCLLFVSLSVALSLIAYSLSLYAHHPPSPPSSVVSVIPHHPTHSHTERYAFSVHSFVSRRALSRTDLSHITLCLLVVCILSPPLIPVFISMPSVDRLIDRSIDAASALQQLLPLFRAVFLSRARLRCFFASPQLRRICFRCVVVTRTKSDFSTLTCAHRHKP